ncbi:hypothetical protein [Actinoplanes sp. NPDC051851]|uniref:hypothetical protein n=1 Tax=Actinoplanes sp. NPDC051851 TaxID=3154753 RepID=UPI0034365A69
MDDEPPPGFLDAVALHERFLRAESVRLTGTDEVYLTLLDDLAAHWRRLSWWSRLTRTDAVGAYLHRRLAKRATAWREDRIHRVEVRVLRPPARAVRTHGSLALDKATVLDTTTRAGLVTLADAGVAWVHAWRRAEHRRVAWLIAGGTLLVIAMIQSMSWLATP